MKHSKTSRRLAVLGCIGLLVLSLGAGVAVASVDIDGEFDGTMEGYAEDTEADNPNEIAVEGEFTVQGEDAQNVAVVLEGAEPTVLDTASVSVFVQGDQSVQFTQQVSQGEVRLLADEIPAGTTIQVSYSTYFAGGTDDTTIDAGEITVEYETAGGTPDEASFIAEADSSDSADNRINALESELAAGEGTSLLMQIFAGIGGLSIMVGLLYGGYAGYQSRQGPDW